MKSSVNQNYNGGTVFSRFLFFFSCFSSSFLTFSWFIRQHQKRQQPLKLFIRIDFVSLFLFFNLCQGFNNFTTNVSSRFLISLSISGFQQIMHCLTYWQVAPFNRSCMVSLSILEICSKGRWNRKWLSARNLSKEHKTIRSCDWPKRFSTSRIVT